jgi:DNA-directed RNA polymerase subunit omega
MNSDLAKKALEKVLNPHVLVNMISRRVRQLNAGHGGASRPMIANSENLRAADIALLEIIEGKMGFDMPEIIELTRPTGRNRKKPQGWAKPHAAKANGEPDASRLAA